MNECLVGDALQRRDSLQTRQQTRVHAERNQLLCGISMRRPSCSLRARKLIIP